MKSYNWGWWEKKRQQSVDKILLKVKLILEQNDLYVKVRFPCINSSFMEEV